MILFAADENFNNNILRGLISRKPELDLIRVQDTELSGADDPTVLEWAAKENRILLTHDVSTITKYTYERIALGKVMPGVIEVNLFCPVGQAIEDILLLWELSFEDELKNQIVYIPLK